MILKKQESNPNYLRIHTMNFSSSHLNSKLKKNIHKVSYPKKLNENGKSINEEIHEIISVEQYLPLQGKKSTKIVNNFKSMETFKSPLTQNGNTKRKSNQNYLRILSDFGE